MTQRDDIIFAKAGEISERGVRNGRYLQALALREMWNGICNFSSTLAAAISNFVKQPTHPRKL